jgi:hypothetical protein
MSVGACHVVLRDNEPVMLSITFYVLPYMVDKSFLTLLGTPRNIHILFVYQTALHTF